MATSMRSTSRRQVPPPTTDELEQWLEDCRAVFATGALQALPRAAPEPPVGEGWTEAATEKLVATLVEVLASERELVAEIDHAAEEAKLELTPRAHALRHTLLAHLPLDAALRAALRQAESEVETLQATKRAMPRSGDLAALLSKLLSARKGNLRKLKKLVGTDE